jgi:Protein of unknown function (DUF2577).
VAGEKLVQFIKGQNVPENQLADLIFANVVTVAPLKVRLENDDRTELSETFLKLSPLCRPKTVSLPVTVNVTTSGGTGTGTGTATGTVWAGLSVGDKVVMLRHQKGNSFFVICREGDL